MHNVLQRQRQRHGIFKNLPHGHKCESYYASTLILPNLRVGEMEVERELEHTGKEIRTHLITRK